MSYSKYSFHQNSHDKNPRSIKSVIFGPPKPIPILKIKNKSIPIYKIYNTKKINIDIYKANEKPSFHDQALKQFRCRQQSLPKKQIRKNVKTPQNLLFCYLRRKNKKNPKLLINPQQNDSLKQKIYKTMTNFKIKVPEKDPNQNKLTQGLRDFLNLSSREYNRIPKKNITKGVIQELQSSIKWKKQFLQIYHNKIDILKKVHSNY